MALTGGTNAEKAWNFLKGKGFNDYACAGIIGNLDCESALNPYNLQDTYENVLGYSDRTYVESVDNGSYSKDRFVEDEVGFGILQWTYHSRKRKLYEFIKSRGTSIGDYESQLEFFYKELTEGFPSVYQSLRAASTVREASDIMLLKYECPYDTSAEVKGLRFAYAQKYYARFSKNTGTGGGNNMGYINVAKKSGMKLSEHFTSNEFDCHGSGCCSTTIVNEKLVEYLEKIRKHFKKPITITSAYRCVTHNRNVGGATGSRHSKGDAADIVVKGVMPVEVAKYAESIGVKGIGLYSDFVHIDTRTVKSYWYGHEQLYRSTFGGTTIDNSTGVTISPIYTVGKTYQTQVILTVRSGAGTNYAKKTYSQLTLNARSNATSDGCLKRGTSVTCMEVKHVGDDIWIRIPSGWCAAYYKGEYYIK